MKTVIEIEKLKSENFKLSKENAFLSTNANVSELETKRLHAEVEKSTKTVQNMVELLYQKDEAIAKVNGELVEMKQYGMTV